MKKNLLVSLCLGTVFAVASQANASTCQINSGAYAGISAGMSTLTGSNEFDSTNTALAQYAANKGKLSKTSAAAGIFAGYGMKFSNFWAAAEVSYQFDKVSDKSKTKVFTRSEYKTLQSSSTGAYGAAIHLGFLPANNVIAYAILGAEVRSFKVKFSDAVTPADIYANINKKYTSIAFAPGVGVRFSIAKNLSIRTEYKYAIHKSKNFTNTAANNAGGKDVLNVKHSPKVHSFNVGVVYSF
jgi:opacity protein-like surface antigen